MSLSADEVRKIAHLARLQINDDQIESYTRDLSRILDLVEQMNAVNTDDVKPMAHPMDATQRLRKDQVSETNQRDKFQQVAPDVEAGLYRVPRVIE